MPLYFQLWPTPNRADLRLLFNISYRGLRYLLLGCWLPRNVGYLDMIRTPFLLVFKADVIFYAYLVL